MDDFGQSFYPSRYKSDFLKWSAHETFGGWGDLHLSSP